jgi:hypothetical protein
MELVNSAESHINTITFSQWRLMQYCKYTSMLCLFYERTNYTHLKSFPLLFTMKLGLPLKCLFYFILYSGNILFILVSANCMNGVRFPVEALEITS